MPPLTRSIEQLNMNRKTIKLHYDKSANNILGAEKVRVKRSSDINCTLSRATMLQTCEASAARLISDNKDATCDIVCRAAVDKYISECNITNKLMVSTSGACKLRGAHPTLEHVYFVIFAVDKILYCDSVKDVGTLHEEAQHLFDLSKQYTENSCCSLEASVDDPIHDVSRYTFEPPLQAPWQRVNSTDYSATVEVTRSNLCLKPATTTIAATTATTAATTAADTEPSKAAQTLKVLEDCMSSRAQRTSSISVIIIFLFMLAVLLH